MEESQTRPAVAQLSLDACLGSTRSCNCTLVELCVDGSLFTVDFELDRTEHRRRVAVGAGPATNTGLLHALWELPEGIPVERRRVSHRDLETLDSLGAGFVEDGDCLTRMFVPAGRVRALVVVAPDLPTAVSRSARLPAIYWRVAAAIGPRRSSPDVVATSERTGVGAVVVNDGVATVLASPQEPVRGVPAVVRWWIAELAYRNWGYGNCAHCSS
jgi:hypothetical protein